MPLPLDKHNVIVTGPFEIANLDGVFWIVNDPEYRFGAKLAITSYELENNRTAHQFYDLYQVKMDVVLVVLNEMLLDAAAA